MSISLSAGSQGSRPFVDGELQGTRQSRPITRPVRWLVDTGSDLSIVRWSTSTSFDWTTNKVGQVSYGTAGGPAIAWHAGPSVVLPSATGPLSHRHWMGVKPNDIGSDLIGETLLRDFAQRWGLTMRWDAFNLTGSIG